jgi:hypothetical protein
MAMDGALQNHCVWPRHAVPRYAFVKAHRFIFLSNGAFLANPVLQSLAGFAKALFSLN